MAIQVALNHRSLYQYERPVRLGPQMVRLRPAPHCRTPILTYSLRIEPDRHSVHWQQDPYNNFLARILIGEKTERFGIEVDLVAELTPVNPFDYFIDPDAENFPFEYPPDLAKDLAAYRAVEPGGTLLKEFLHGVSREQRSTIGFLVDLNRRITDEIAYSVRLDPGIQKCEETLQRRTGSCRDSAWLLVQMLRQLGIASRFVSGYLVQLASGTNEPGERTEDSVELHAWAEAYLPGAGWIGFDQTSGLLTTENHIPLACTPDAPNAAHITGSVEPSRVEFSYSMSVRRLDDRPTPAKPYRDDQWLRIQNLGREVDADLVKNDVRLTMGGEPTFVGVDEPESAEWNLDALGPLKRPLATKLIRGIQTRVAPGALLHFGQGKWYPGESLPRWALSCYWRVDGVPMWENAELIARDQSYDFQPGYALEFLETLARRLQVSAANILPAYEDALYYLWRERRLSVDLNTLDANSGTEPERQALARVFERDITEPTAYVLPLRRRQCESRKYWSSQLWFPRPERLFLLTGESSVGYRLPVESLPWVAPDAEAGDRPDLSADLPPRSSRMDLFDANSVDDPLPAASTNPEPGEQTVRPALCVQVREGRMHVFLPFVPALADYLDLLAAIEDTCRYLEMPVWIEGYLPPPDPRVRSFSVTPDPGVLEINLPPAWNWDELEQLNTLVFEEAQKTRLVAEKFLFNGKHVSTGGGNHIVIGGATVADSPVLRRPDLLRSMLTFWQNHPSLSYLFSGTFIGPTSQYPRVDEARTDILYELELAFSQLPQEGCSPELLDKLFRNFLADLTGNTHRAEFCVDKLFPPQGAGLRLGLLELRAFEMAPHVRMGLLELLLVRALIAMFWQKPYHATMVPWGTTLHDRFLLPHFVKQDFSEVLAFLRRFGHEFEGEWFSPHFEFRFPMIGSMVVKEMQLELRQALEPWPVLGEEAASGGTSRTVDSSVDRLQVKVSGLAGSRYAIACNGRRVPLKPTGTAEEAVAAVRFTAWQLASCLHPTIPVHSPLIFDVVDQWNEHSVGGCSYDVTRPGGGSYNARPVDAAEAESRRAERFQSFGHTPGPMVVPQEEPNPNFPLTLDLRRPAVQKSAQAGIADRLP